MLLGPILSSFFCPDEFHNCFNQKKVLRANIISIKNYLKFLLTQTINKEHTF